MRLKNKMVVIRLTRGGTNKRPFYHVVIADRRKSRDGRFIERIGYFNPIACGGENRLQLNKERFDFWITQGAQPSERVASLVSEIANPALVTKRKAQAKVRNAKLKEKAKVKAEAQEPAEASA